MPFVLRNLHTKYGLVRPKTKELLTYYCGCHGNLVTIATRYVADAFCPKEPPYQIWTQCDLRQRSYKAKCRLRLIDSDSFTHWTHKIGRLSIHTLSQYPSEKE